MTDAKSFEGAMRWIKQIKDVKDIPLIMVGNKAELEEYRILTDQNFADIHESTQIPCIQTSAYTG
jgi:GTPase SAR1 family protein